MIEQFGILGTDPLSRLFGRVMIGLYDPWKEEPFTNPLLGANPGLELLHALGTSTEPTLREYYKDLRKKLEDELWQLRDDELTPILTEALPFSHHEELSFICLIALRKLHYVPPLLVDLLIEKKLVEEASLRIQKQVSEQNPKYFITSINEYLRSAFSPNISDHDIAFRLIAGRIASSEEIFRVFADNCCHQYLIKKNSHWATILTTIIIKLKENRHVLRSFLPVFDLMSEMERCRRGNGKLAVLEASSITLIRKQLVQLITSQANTEERRYAQQVIEFEQQQQVLANEITSDPLPPNKVASVNLHDNGNPHGAREEEKRFGQQANLETKDGNEEEERTTYQIIKMAKDQRENTSKQCAESQNHDDLDKIKHTLHELRQIDADSCFPIFSAPPAKFNLNSLEVKVNEGHYSTASSSQRNSVILDLWHDIKSLISSRLLETSDKIVDEKERSEYIVKFLWTAHQLLFTSSPACTGEEQHSNCEVAVENKAQNVNEVTPENASNPSVFSNCNPDQMEVDQLERGDVEGHKEQKKQRIRTNKVRERSEHKKKNIATEADDDLLPISSSSCSLADVAESNNHSNQHQHHSERSSIDSEKEKRKSKHKNKRQRDFERQDESHDESVDLPADNKRLKSSFALLNIASNKVESFLSSMQSTSSSISSDYLLISREQLSAIFTQHQQEATSLADKLFFTLQDLQQIDSLPSYSSSSSSSGNQIRRCMTQDIEFIHRKLTNDECNSKEEFWNDIKQRVINHLVEEECQENERSEYALKFLWTAHQLLFPSHEGMWPSTSSSSSNQCCSGEVIDLVDHDGDLDHDGDKKEDDRSTESNQQQAVASPLLSSKETRSLESSKQLFQSNQEGIEECQQQSHSHVTTSILFQPQPTEILLQCRQALESIRQTQSTHIGDNSEVDECEILAALPRLSTVGPLRWSILLLKQLQYQVMFLDHLARLLVGVYQQQQEDKSRLGRVIAANEEILLVLQLCLLRVTTDLNLPSMTNITNNSTVSILINEWLPAVLHAASSSCNAEVEELNIDLLVHVEQVESWLHREGLVQMLQRLMQSLHSQLNVQLRL